jgi:hypothetical protein
VTCGTGDASPGLCVACGTLDEPCCGATGNRSCTDTNTQCTGAGANSTGTCMACGAANQACCGGAGGTCGTSSLVCRVVAGAATCEACGGPGDPCCGTGANRTCTAGLTCTRAEVGGGNPNNDRCE